MKKLFLISVISSFLILLSCEDSTKYDRELAVYGQVIDEDGNPVANADVYVFPDLSTNSVGIIEKSNKILEVELTSFDAIDKIEYVQLEWETATEMNNKMFVIEKSVNNSTDFIPIDSIDGSGTTIEPVSYQYQDFEINPNEFYMYRLKIVNLAGEYAYSDIISLQPFNPVIQISNPSPNPFKSQITFSFSVLDYDNQYVEIKEQSTGEVVATFDNFDDFSYNSITFSGYKDGKDIRPGVYNFKLHYADSVKTVKFVKHLEFDKYYSYYSEPVTKTDENGLFKVTYNFFPDLEEHLLIAENGQELGNFMYGGGAEIVVRKELLKEANVTKFLISKNQVDIDKTRILEITCNAEEVLLP